MMNNNNNKLVSPFNGKTSGLAYSLSAALPELLGLLIMLVVTMLGTIIGGDVAKSEAYNWVLIASSQVAFFLVCAVIIKSHAVDFVSELGLKVKPNVKYALLGVLFTVGLMFFFSPIINILVQGLQSLGYKPKGAIPDLSKWYNYVVAIFLIAVLPALMEESLFRGVILSGLKKYGMVFCIIATSIFFVLMHKSIEQTIYQFALALGLCYATLKCRSIYVPIIMHFVNNFVIITLQFLGVYGVGTLVWEWIAMGVGGLVVAAIVVYEFVISKQRLEMSEDTDGEAAVPKKVLFTYAAFGIVFNVVMLIIGLFL